MKSAAYDNNLHTYKFYVSDLDPIESITIPCQKQICALLEIAILQTQWNLKQKEGKLHKFVLNIIEGKQSYQAAIQYNLK